MDSRRGVNPPPGGRSKPDPRRQLPAISWLTAQLQRARGDLPEWAVLEGARRVVEDERSTLSGPEAGRDAGDVDWLARAGAAAEALARRHPRRVVNATGVVLHTNLGRAPIAEAAADAAREAASNYSDLELDLESGRRGSRLTTVSEKLRLLSGAEEATVCNNNAAAVLLVLDTLARGREVVVSRGELVEIGGSFRVPEIMERAGVRLVEIGTTNRTHARDYENAIGPETALLLKVHRSNFHQTGFVAEVGLEGLVAIGRRHGLPVVEDLGSGTLLDLPRSPGRGGLPPESFAPSRVRAGADVVCFSGDKLLGGPQAGIAVGRREAIAAMRASPLARALRLDKMSLAALDWTLGAILDGSAEAEIPALRMLLEPLDSLERRARDLADRLRGSAAVEVSVERDRAPVGGGSLPDFELDTWVVALRGGPSSNQAAAALRAAEPPVLARLRDDALVLDVRTLRDEEIGWVEAAVAAALR